MVRSRWLGGKKPALFLARWPSDKAMQQARDRIRDLTRRSRLLLAPEWIAEDLNRFLRGWAAYFRFGNWPAGPHWLVGARATSWRITGI
jgi:RNA-directed DNA polymerase